ncbi:expressed unknown protein [Seminavis robusta]|uniref:Uncharacterized protein n=1 Tax=Seminavis robusta TaxID=568900 RepID=A0A9N8DV47_9STRA|nr:expressed unknown protein [Seminavis robusta]|eukprot:Sro380_g130670.1 n/a (511) ;mRNA; f:40777-42309
MSNPFDQLFRVLQGQTEWRFFGIPVAADDASTGGAGGEGAADLIDAVLTPALNAPADGSRRTYFNLRFSPLELALMAKADIGTVTRLYDACPAALDQNLFWNLCRCGAQVGVLAYLVNRNTQLAGVQTHDRWYPINLAMEKGGHSDMDIRALAQAHPGSLSSNLYPYVNALRIALRRSRFRRGLIQFLFQLSPMFHDQSMRFPGDVLEEEGSNGGQVVPPMFPEVDDSNTPQFRAHLNMDCAYGMVPMLLSCVKFYNYCQKWKSDAFMQVWHNLLASIKLQKVITCVPNTFEFNINQQWFQTPQFRSLASTSKIEHLQLWDGVDNACSHSLLKDCALHLKHLVKLEICIIKDLLSTGRIICELLMKEHAVLRELDIRASRTPTGKLYPLLNALAGNKSLEAFVFDGESNTVPYQEYLEEILWCSNTTISRIRLNTFTTSANASSDPLSYYVANNMAGRGKVREVDLTLDGFISLLNHADSMRQGVTELDVANELYGLLRESPKRWSPFWD